MLPVSKEFHAAMVADNRRTFGRIVVDYTDPLFDQSVTVTANQQANAAVLLPQVADNLATVPRRWASADGTTLADGLSFPAPSVPTDGQMGWWGEQMAGVGGAFSPSFPALTVSFASRPVHGLRVVGDSVRGEFPVDFEIRLLGTGGAVRHTRTVTGNALMVWQETITPVTEVTQYVVEVRRWSHAGRQAKIVEVFTSIQETYEGDNLISISLLEERELAQQGLPVGIISANEIMVKLDNSTRRFDAGNRGSPLYQLLRQNRRIRAWLGAEIGGVMEWVPLGTFWSGEWTAQREKLYASTTGRDRLEFLRKSTYPASQVFVNQSLHALATTILTNAGLNAAEYWVDPALQNIIVPNAWFGTVSHREALRQISEASLGQVYCDRNGVIRVEGAGHLLGQESFVSPMMSSTQSLTISADDYFRKDTPVKWGELANRIEVETQPLRAVATAQEVFRSNEPVPIAAGQTLTLTVRYNEPPVIDAVASILSSWIWRDTFDTDQISTHYTSGGDVLATWTVSGGVLSATGGIQATLLRTGLTLADGEIIANVDQAHDGGLIARHVDNNNYYLLGLHDDSGVHPTTNLRLWRRVAGAFISIADANVNWTRGTAAQIRFRFNGSLLEAWFNNTRVITVTDTTFTSGGVGMRQRGAEVTRFLDFAVHPSTTITATTFYAWGADVTAHSPNAGTFTLIINGRPLRILNKERAVTEDPVSIRDNGLLRYEFPANHLVQTLSRAQAIADTLLRLYRHPRRDLAMDWRGNPALTLGDMIITRDHQDWLRYWVTKQEIDYDGALRARLEGRLAR